MIPAGIKQQRIFALWLCCCWWRVWSLITVIFWGRRVFPHDKHGSGHFHPKVTFLTILLLPVCYCHDVRACLQCSLGFRVQRKLTVVNFKPYLLSWLPTSVFHMSDLFYTNTSSVCVLFWLCWSRDLRLWRLKNTVNVFFIYIYIFIFVFLHL